MFILVENDFLGWEKVASFREKGVNFRGKGVNFFMRTEEENGGRREKWSQSDRIRGWVERRN